MMKTSYKLLLAPLASVMMAVALFSANPVDFPFDDNEKGLIEKTTPVRPTALLKVSDWSTNGLSHFVTDDRVVLPSGAEIFDIQYTESSEVNRFSYRFRFGDVEGTVASQTNPDGTTRATGRGRYTGPPANFVDMNSRPGGKTVVMQTPSEAPAGKGQNGCYTTPIPGCFFGPGIPTGFEYGVNFDGVFPLGFTIGQTFDMEFNVNIGAGPELHLVLPYLVAPPPLPTGSITGIKFHDRNGDGVQDPGEEPLENWSIVLDGGPTSQLTGPDGKYTFQNVLVGSHLVEEDIQTGWQPSPNLPPSQAVIVVANEQAVVNFGNYQPATIKVIKFIDVNGDGVLDEMEPFSENWEFTVVGSQTTNAMGEAEFPGLPPGVYEVTETPQTGWKISTPQTNPTTVIVASGETKEVLFGNYKPGKIIVHKFHDKNGNKAQDTGEEDLPGWEIKVDSATKMTDAAGKAEFDQLDPGPHEVSETVKTGWAVSTGNNPTTVLVLHGQTKEVEFGNYMPAKIILKKFHDENGDGAKNGTEPFLPGWTVKVDTDSKVTNGSGEATFDGLKPGTYSVSEVLQTGWKLSTGNSPKNIIVVSGDTKTEQFGNFKPGKITVLKFRDENGNGVRDAGDSPVSGWSIKCVGPSCKPPGITQNTVANGTTTFSSLDPGNYVISEGVRAGWMQTSPVAGIYNVAIKSADMKNVAFGNKPPPPPPPPPPGAGDWGDAPESVDPDFVDIFPVGYPTSIGNNGAAHPLNPEIRIGPTVDGDPGGQPTLPADGDDADGGDDEDGVTFESDFIPLFLKLDPASDDVTSLFGQVRGTSSEIIVKPSATGMLDAWVDWDRSGSWEAGEKIYGQIIGPTETRLDWPIPVDASVGFTYARFRFSIAGSSLPGGPGPEGEVEDYILYTLDQKPLDSTADTEDVNPGDGICADASGNCTVRAAIMEANAAGVPLLISASSLAKSGRAVLQPLSPYPPITGVLLLDGDGTLEIDGSQAGAGANGLTLQSPGAIIANTIIYGFDGAGILLNGDDQLLFGNQIRNNAGPGISVIAGSGNQIRNNAIFENGGLGIDLNADGVTQNDVGDVDVGPNGLQNAPTLGVVTAEDGHIEGNLMSIPDTEFNIEFFVSPTCDPSGYGEGMTFLSSETVTTDNIGSTGFNVFIDQNPIAVGEAVTAIATGPEGTSEFSSCFFAVSTAIERIEDAEVPQDYELFQNYPNPFNPVTNIRFAISNREWVKLEVYDILGKRVATLVDGWVESGEFTVDFDASELPSGIYIYRMTAGSFTTAKQLTLLK
ncbi:MAG: hypothetical protein BMS9Abin05_0926 [Rhodothermia bacterium]|nr:MAG: hypothetical protein BMS9Abin05_0926 [Rhodothermia bacterium]